MLSFSAADYVLFIATYLIASVPYGVIIARFSGTGDLRQQGSGNIGATNMLRVGGVRLGVLTFLLDGLKGMIPVLVTRYYANHGVILEASVPIVAVIAVLGHMFPIWLKFKGGKGVATTMLVLVALYWPLGLVACAVWLGVFFMTRISSLSALLAMIAVPTIALFMVELIGHFSAYACFAISIMVIARHHQNIQRLINGEERRLR